MRDYQRQYPEFSLCGLNCGLCPRYHADGVSGCPGCGGEGFFKKRPACGVISCARRHGEIEYCYLCAEYPCKKYDNADATDSFISQINQRKDMEKAKRLGIDGYRAELDEKVRILRDLLGSYNDGRHKSFFCVAVNLLELSDIKSVMERLAVETTTDNTVKEKSAAAVRLFECMADRRNMSLKLRKKEK